LRKWKQELLPRASYVNEYGPTETVVGAACGNCGAGRGEELEGQVAAPIGRPIENTQLYVLEKAAVAADQQRRRAVYRRSGLARGYLNQEELTRERFVANGYGGESGGRCTGRETW